MLLLFVIFVQQIAAIDIPYLEDFESGSGGFSSPAEWDNVTSVRMGKRKLIATQFQANTKVSMNSCYSGTNCWMTSRAQYRENNLSYLESPEFNLTGSGNYVLRFALYCDSDFDSGVNVQTRFPNQPWTILTSTSAVCC